MTTTRTRPVFDGVDELVDVVVEGVIVTVPGEARNKRRTRLFPYPLIILDDRGQPGTVYLTASWMVNDGVAGTLPVDCDSQRTARQLADAFVSTIDKRIVDAAHGDQVDAWCRWWIGAGNTDRARYVETHAATTHVQITPQREPVDGGDQAPALVMIADSEARA